MTRFHESKITSWAELQALAQAKHGSLFRGQGSVAFGLQTTLERCLLRNGIPNSRWSEVEFDLMREFRRAYHHYAARVPPPSHTAEWLSLMQHHGAPTRLLDFTYSIYIATYFALERADGDAAVWVVDGRWALEESAGRFANAGKSASDVATLRGRFMEGDEAITQNLLYKAPFVAVACPLNPFHLNERLRIQKGVFLATGDVSLSFEDNLVALPGHDVADNLQKVVIPSTLRAEALQQLHQMNISRASLFPGLDGYAQALGVYHPSFVPGGMFWYAPRP